MLSGFLFIIVGAIFFASQYVPKNFAQQPEPVIYSISMHAGIAILGILFFISSLLTIHYSLFTTLAIILAIITGLVWGIANRVFINAIFSIGLARSFTLVNFATIITFLLAILSLNELRNTNSILVGFAGMSIIIVGCLLITQTNRANNNTGEKKGYVYGFIAVTLFGIYNVILTYTLKFSEIPKTILFMGLGILLSSFITNRPVTIKRWLKMDKRTHILALFSGFLWCSGIILTSHSLNLVGASITIPMLNGFVTLFSSFWGLVVFREFQTINANVRKRAFTIFLSGAFLTIIGIIIISRIV